MKKFLLFFILFIPFSPSYGQKQGQQLADSLLQELGKGKYKCEDTNKVNLLDEISFDLSDIDPNKGTLYAQQALQLAQHLAWPPGIALSYSYLGYNCKSRSDYAEALAYAFKALKLFEKLGDARGIGSQETGIGNIYFELGDYSKALTYDSAALHMAIVRGDKEVTGLDLGNLGTEFLKTNNLPKALECFTNSLKISEDLGDILGIAISLENIGGVYKRHADFEKALQYYFKALAINTQHGVKDDAELNLENIGEVYLKIFIDSARKIKADSLIPASRQENLHNAYDFFVLAMAIAKETNDLNGVLEISESLSETDALSGNYKEALAAYQQYTKYKDSVFSKDNEVKIADLGTKRETDLKDKQIQINKLEEIQKGRERYAFIIGVCLLCVIIILIYRTYKQQKSVSETLATANRTLAEKRDKLERANEQLSEQKQIIDVQNKELGKTIREKDRILTVVAHDLRSPVGAVAYLADLMLMEGEQTMKPEESLAMIKTASASSLELINELLGLSDNSKEELEKENTEINSFVKDCVNLLEYKAKEKQQTITTQLLESPATVSISREKMSRVISNLVGNAIKFTPAGGGIHIALQKKDTSVLITIQDNGIGIPAAMQADVFEIFTTSKRKGTGGEKSFGLGLSISKQIVAAHGGIIWLESEEGKGTTFYIEIGLSPEV